MGDEVKEAATGVEAAAEVTPGPATEARQIYNPHIELADAMKQRLRDCTMRCFEKMKPWVSLD